MEIILKTDFPKPTWKFTNHIIVFFQFVFKIRLIRLDFSFQKNFCIWTHNLLIPSQEP